MKAQIFTADFSVALVIFISLMGLATYLVFLAPTTKSSLLSSANELSDYIADRRFGTENFLECGDLADFASLSYAEQKKEFGADFFVDFENKTKACGGAKIDSGFNFTNKTSAASVSRIVLIGKENMRMRVVVYG